MTLTTSQEVVFFFCGIIPQCLSRVSRYADLKSKYSRFLLEAAFSFGIIRAMEKHRIISVTNTTDKVGSFEIATAKKRVKLYNIRPSETLDVQDWGFDSSAKVESDIELSVVYDSGVLAVGVTKGS